MIAYLDALIDALTVRDAGEVERLLAHPLARILPDDARREAAVFMNGTSDPLAAPLRVMQLRHRTAELLADDGPFFEAEVADEAPRAPRAEPASRTRRAARMQQMELPLSA
jgi:hypothetical protein